MRSFPLKWLAIFLISLLTQVHATEDASKQSVIEFQRSPYGLIFTEVNVNGALLLAMIDIGDQQTVQLASTLTDKLKIPLQATGYKAMNVQGEQRDVYQGTMQTFKLGSGIYTDMAFTTSPGDIEAVAEQIGTEFSAVIGWGYFNRHIIEFDYHNDVIRLHDSLPEGFEPLMKTAYSDQYGPLLLSVYINGKSAFVMLDTGATVSVFDPSLVTFGEDNRVNFELAGENIVLYGYEQDLSVLADLNVVGILGSDFLSRFKVIINPVTSEMNFVAYPQKSQS